MLPKVKITRCACRLVVALASTCSLLPATDLSGHGLRFGAAVAGGLAAPDASTALTTLESLDGHKKKTAPSAISAADMAKGHNDGWHLSQIALLDKGKDPLSDNIAVLENIELGPDPKTFFSVTVDFPDPGNLPQAIGARLTVSALSGLQSRKNNKGSGFSSKPHRLLLSRDSVTYLRGLLGF